MTARWRLTGFTPLNMVLVCVMLTLMWRYARRHELVDDPGGTPFQQICLVQNAVIFGAVDRGGGAIPDATFGKLT